MATNIWDDLKLRFRQGNATIRLIMANVSVHVIIALMYVPIFLIFGKEKLINPITGKDYFSEFIEQWLYFPSELTLIPVRVWTIFTYMFLHNGLWHIFMNMLILYWFGEKLNSLLPNSKILPLYIWGGIAGALMFTIGFNIFPAFDGYNGNLVGASASVMAIVLATATLNPKGTIHFMFIGAIELQYVALVWVIFNLVVIPGGNPGGALAHLGGAFMGWFFIHQLGKGVDLAKPINRILDWFRGKRLKSTGGSAASSGKKRQTKGAFKAKMGVYKGSQKTDYYGNEYGRSFMQKYKEMSREECLNTILEKIKRSGYDGLTEDEKVFLNRYQ